MRNVERSPVYMLDPVSAERAHCVRVLKSLKSYQTNTREAYKAIAIPKEASKSIQQDWKNHLNELEKCIKQNQRLLNDIVLETLEVFPMAEHLKNECLEAETCPTEPKQPRSGQMSGFERIQSTLKQICRDWSADGAQEREMCYGPILKELQRVYERSTSSEGNRLRVLVPGAGLGRLAFEIARLGFDCEANEFSLYMLFSANLILNQCSRANVWTIYPWVHHFSNLLSHKSMLKAVDFPDVDPNVVMSGNDQTGAMSMTAGDFLEVYAQPEYKESKDCVVTCFFLDCARNVVDFIQLISVLLKPGGRWINLGPLLYHYSDMPGEGSIEPSYESVKKLIELEGFEFDKEETGVKAVYCHNDKSMIRHEYSCVFFSCVKKPNANEK